MWELEPACISIADAEKIYNDMELLTFRTLAQAKKYLKKESENLKKEIEKFLQATTK